MGMLRPLTPPASAALDLQLAEQVFYDLPPLEGVFLYWHTHGVAATPPGITSLLYRREQMLGKATLPAASIKLLYECATVCLQKMPVYSPWDSRPLHARVLRHTPSFNAFEAQALLPPGVLVQKTITLSLGKRLLLASGAGTWSLTPRHLAVITAALTLPRRSLTRCSINSLLRRSVRSCAMQPELVSPFLHPEREAQLTALVLQPVPGQWKAQAWEVAIPLSLWESLTLPLPCLRPLLRRYARRAYPQIRILELGHAGAMHAYKEESDGC